jgi:hypothetical protein
MKHMLGLDALRFLGKGQAPLECGASPFIGADCETEESEIRLDSFSGTREESPFLSVNLVIPADEISARGKAILLGDEDLPSSVLEAVDRWLGLYGSEKLLLESETLPSADVREPDSKPRTRLLGLEGKRLSWIALELPTENPSIWWYRGDAGRAACGCKGAFYPAVKVALRTEALFGFLREVLLDKHGKKLKPVPELIEQKDIMKSGGFHVCVGALYPPFMDYIDCIAEDFRKAISGGEVTRERSAPLERVPRRIVALALVRIRN